MRHLNFWLSSFFFEGDSTGPSNTLKDMHLLLKNARLPSLVHQHLTEIRRFNMVVMSCFVIAQPAHFVAFYVGIASICSWSQNNPLTMRIVS